MRVLNEFANVESRPLLQLDHNAHSSPRLEGPCASPRQDMEHHTHSEPPTRTRTARCSEYHEEPRQHLILRHRQLRAPNGNFPPCFGPGSFCACTHALCRDVLERRAICARPSCPPTDQHSRSSTLSRGKTEREFLMLCCNLRPACAMTCPDYPQRMSTLHSDRHLRRQTSIWEDIPSVLVEEVRDRTSSHSARHLCGPLMPCGQLVAVTRLRLRVQAVPLLGRSSRARTAVHLPIKTPLFRAESLSIQLS
ncbi:hypothetical protein C8Q76DRAFT_178053 [Earliella scabrosa]|nr:hypothetical protein C8Q76DRAFT_178053 [Earliella scabrosa]